MKNIKTEPILGLSDELIQSFENRMIFNYPNDALYKSKEVEQLLKCSARTLFKLRSEGILKPIKIGGTYYYTTESLRKLICTSNIKEEKEVDSIK